MICSSRSGTLNANKYTVSFNGSSPEGVIGQPPGRNSPSLRVTAGVYSSILVELVMPLAYL
jgi:hypothetical protein